MRNTLQEASCWASTARPLQPAGGAGRPAAQARGGGDPGSGEQLDPRTVGDWTIAVGAGTPEEQWTTGPPNVQWGSEGTAS